MPENPYRALPSVDALLGDPRLQRGDPALVTAVVRETLADIRSSMSAGAAPPGNDEVIETVAARLESALAAPLRMRPRLPCRGDRVPAPAGAAWRPPGPAH